MFTRYNIYIKHGILMPAHIRCVAQAGLEMSIKIGSLYKKLSTCHVGLRFLVLIFGCFLLGDSLVFDVPLFSL